MISYLEAKPFSIYLVLNTVNGKVYVGKTERRLNKRWTEHKGRTSQTVALRNAMLKYGRDNFRIIVLRDGIETLAELNRLEVYYIAACESTKKEFGYNLTKGGDGGALTDEGRARRREQLAKFPNPFKGKHHSLENRTRWSEQRRGSKQSSETVEKRRAKLRGAGNPFFGKRPEKAIEAARIVNIGAKHALGHRCPNPYAKGHPDFVPPEARKRAGIKCSITKQRKRAEREALRAATTA